MNKVTNVCNLIFLKQQLVNWESVMLYWSCGGHDHFQELKKRELHAAWISIFRNQQLAKRVNLLQEEAEAAAKGKKGGRWRRETRWDQKRTEYISFSIILGPGDIQHSLGCFGQTSDNLLTFLLFVPSSETRPMMERKAIDPGMILQKL